MAIILIAMGVIMFISQINESSAINMAFKLWPLTLILLGIEILWFRYKSSDEGTIIKYDIFSIFIVFTILMVNIGLYAITETGVISVIKSKVIEESYDYELPNQEFVVDDSIEKIIIEGLDGSNINVRTTEGNKILTTGDIVINSDNEENAKKIYDKNIVKIEKFDNTIYVKYNLNSDYYLRNVSISLPSNKKVEVNGGNQLDLVMDSIDSNWVVDGVERVNVRLNKELNMMVSTTVRNEDNLGGNANWTNTQVGPDENHNHKGELIYGDGMNILNILNAYEVIVDEV